MELVCTVSICKEQFFNSKVLLKHLKDHILDGFTVQCPASNCDRCYKVVSSFTSHVSRCHKAALSNLESNQSSGTSISSCVINLDPQGVSEVNNDQNMQLDLPITDKNSIKSTGNTRDHALFLMFLQYKYLIPGATVQKIAENVNGLLIKYKDKIVEDVQIALANEKVSDGITDTIVNSIQSSFNFDENVVEVLRSDYSRKIYFQDNFMFISPITYHLHDLAITETNNSASYQYVSILASLKAMFKSSEVQQQFWNVKNNDVTMLSDYNDGKAFKNNLLFSQKPQSIQIILYQDSFEVVNPLGSAKTCHKVLAVYFSLGNLYSHNRSQINPMQLVILCKEKFVNNDNIFHLFKPLIHDLKILETEGIDIGLDEKVIGSIVAIAGDNLGSHWIGGYVVNFSTASHFCRYCTIEKIDFVANIHQKKELRTVASYNACVVADNNQIAQNHVCGVKFSSPFNELNYFHVCNPALPPCIAHDIFEGVVSFDVMMFIKYFIREGWFTEDFLNEAISNFNFDPISSQSKCVPVKKNSSKLGGNASQNWCMARFMPLFILQKVKSVDDPVWRAFLRLRLLIEVVCAPRISYNQIAFMDLLIDEYLDLRLNCFRDKPLRPKHHYLSHYPWLTLQFGPLIHLWTLRFESKHSYFKKIARSYGNFINVTSTLSNTHQMLQTYLNETELFQPELSYNVDSCTVYSDEVIFTFSKNNIDIADCVLCRDATYKGTCYKVPQLLVLGKNGFDIRLGQIVAVFIFEGALCFCVKYCNGYFLPHFGVYYVEFETKPLACINVNELHDYYPLYAHKTSLGFESFVLKHSLI